MKVCEHCHIKYGDNDNFCRQCGNKLSIITVKTSSVAKDDNWFHRYSGTFELTGFPQAGSKIFVSDGHFVWKFEKEKPILADEKLSDITGFGFVAVKKGTRIYLDRLSYINAVKNGNDSGLHLSIPGGTKCKVFIRTKNCQEGYMFHLRNMENYSPFVDLLWKACASSVIRDILVKLREGKKFVLDPYSYLEDDGIVKRIPHFFSSDETVKYNWMQTWDVMLIKHDGDDLRLEFTDRKCYGGNEFVIVNIDGEVSSTILEWMIRCERKYSLKKLSDLLEYI